MALLRAAAVPELREPRSADFAPRMEALTPETALVLRVRLEKVAREGRWEEAAANGARALQLLDGAPRWQPNIDCCDELARIGLALAKMGMMGEGAPVERLLERVLHSPTAGTNALRTATAALKLAVGADFDAFCACAFGAEAGGHQGCGDGGPPPPLDALPSLELIEAILELMDEPTCPLLARRATPSMQAALRSASRATRQRALELTSRFVHTAPSAMCGLVPLLSSAVFNETAELASYALAALADAAALLSFLPASSAPADASRVLCEVLGWLPSMLRPPAPLDMQCIAALGIGKMVLERTDGCLLTECVDIELLISELAYRYTSSDAQTPAVAPTGPRDAKKRWPTLEVALLAFESLVGRRKADVPNTVVYIVLDALDRGALHPEPDAHTVRTLRFLASLLDAPTLEPLVSLVRLNLREPLGGNAPSEAEVRQWLGVA